MASWLLARALRSPDWKSWGFFGRGGERIPVPSFWLNKGFLGGVELKVEREREKPGGRVEREGDGWWERSAPGRLTLCPPLQTCLLSPALARLSLLAEAAEQTGWAVTSPPLASPPSPVPPPLPPPLPAPSPPPFSLSLLSPLVIKENSSWPDQTSNAVPRAAPHPLPLALRGPLLHRRARA